MDSALTAAIAFEKHELLLLHANYGQRTEKRELRAFRDIAKHYKAGKTLVVDLSHLKAIGASSLTDRSIEVTKADLKTKSVPSSYVPFRNANLLASAVSWAEAEGAAKIYIGAVEEDSSGYPDCRRSFFDAYERMIKLGTKKGTNIRIITPIIGLSKRDIVRRSLQMKVPLQLTWSCYKSSARACGECDSCALRLRGFRLAGEKDKIPYAKMNVY
ncbi:MAG: 7-cyano-7-deazaguanine synthase QueC [Ignavibacteria bacterium]|nr:7-cyano-7-deazaguanine synthase QueC [Ignavibacteria bacterium]